MQSEYTLTLPVLDPDQAVPLQTEYSRLNRRHIMEKMNPRNPALSA